MSLATAILVAPLLVLIAVAGWFGWKLFRSRSETRNIRSTRTEATIANEMREAGFDDSEIAEAIRAHRDPYAPQSD